jgi:hypothetical protein
VWNCRHCNEEFDYSSTSQKANHSRWCDKNPKRNDWDSGKGTLNQFGELRNYNVTCENCNTSFIVEEREKLHPQKESYYCNRSCANSVGGRAKSDKDYSLGNLNYRTICEKHHEMKCLVCGEEKIVAVHHVDEDHSNNDPKNLVPLCPTHHQYVHSRYRDEVQPIIDRYIEEKWGGMYQGGENALQAI